MLQRKKPFNTAPTPYGKRHIHQHGGKRRLQRYQRLLKLLLYARKGGRFSNGGRGRHGRSGIPRKMKLLMEKSGNFGANLLYPRKGRRFSIGGRGRHGRSGIPRKMKHFLENSGNFGKNFFKLLMFGKGGKRNGRKNGRKTGTKTGRKHGRRNRGGHEGGEGGLEENGEDFGGFLPLDNNENEMIERM